MVDALRAEVDDLRQQLFSSKKRQKVLERMNAEIEHRLEAEARHRMDIEGEFASFKNAAMAEKIIAENEVASWKQRCQNLIQRDEHHKQTIHRLERDLYRFQLRKYDMQKAWERREAAASKEAATQER